MEAVTDVVFRHVVAAATPPDVWFTEFTNATGWAHAGDRAIGGRLVKTDDEHPIVAQLWGSDPASMEKLAKHCAELGYDGVDINMGCPDQSAVKSGGGAGMILNPENAAAIIAAAKTSGLPISIKTRLGYRKIDEYQEWISHILHQNIANFTIHLRTKKEMSKVPAHFELIPEIKKLRDEIAPHTLLTINGDIRDRAHGIELVEQYGVDGIMIGRGIFHNPFAFAFAHSPPLPSSQIAEQSARRSLDTGPVSESTPSFETSEMLSKAGVAPLTATRAHDSTGEPLATKSEETSAARVSSDVGTRLETRSEAVSDDFVNEKRFITRA
jgi:tRNA-dihydrouridine synthase